MPLTVTEFQLPILAPGVSCTNERGFRIAPAPIPKLTGRELILSPEIVVDCSALSVFSMPVSAVTTTEVADGPTCMATSIRLVTAT